MYKTTSCHDVYQIENKIKFLIAEALRGVDSLIFDARVTAETQQAQLSNEVASSTMRNDRRRWTQTQLGSPAVVAHRQDNRNPCPDAEADPSSSDRATNDPLVTQRQVPTSQKIPKTVEIPQAQFMETNP